MREKIKTSFVVLITALAFGFPVWASYVIPDGSVLTAKIATGAVAQAKMSPRPVASIVPSGGMAISSSCGNYTVTNALTAVTNLSVTITTTGRPVWVGLVSDGSINVADILATTFVNPGTISSITIVVEIYRGSTLLSFQDVQAMTEVVPAPATLIGSTVSVPVSAVSHIDAVAAGTYNYLIKSDYINLQGGAAGSINNAKLVAYEL